VTLSVFDAARDEPTRLALIAGGLELSFSELAGRVERRLAELHAAGALDADGHRPVALVARPRLATLETLLALLAAGTPALVLHARGTASEHEALRLRAGAVAEPFGGPAGSVPPLAPFEPERIAAIVPTSGSTGAPRLSKLSHRAFLAAASAAAGHFGVEANDRWLLSLPLAHIGGLCGLTRALVTRRTTVLFEPERPLLHELERLVDCAERNAVTVVSLVPTILERLLAPPVAWRPPASLRAALLGGAAIARSLVARARSAGVPVMPTYGMTEVCAQAVTGPYASRLALVEPGPELFASGVPIPGVEARIVDGLIELRGPTLFSGYLGDPASDPHGGWLKTQDRGHLDERGELVVTGRASDLIITGGENVDPLELEAALGSLPGIEQAYVFGVPDETFGELIAALLVVAPGGPRTAEAVAERLASRLASYKLPRRVAVTDELPLTPAGKLDRHAARSLRQLAR